MDIGKDFLFSPRSILIILEKTQTVSHDYRSPTPARAGFSPYLAAMTFGFILLFFLFFKFFI